MEKELGEWLKDDAPPMSPRLRASVRDRVRATPQLASSDPAAFRQRWSGRPLRLELLAAAAVLVIAVAAALSALQAPVSPGGSGSASHGPSGLQSFVGPTVRLSAAASPTPTPLPDPFTATWYTLDVDGSVYVVIFGGTGPTRRVTVTDLRATFCAGGSDVIEATGTIDGNTIAYEGLAGCIGEATDRPAGSTFTFDVASDTLRLPYVFPGGDTLVWAREPLMDAFDGTWTATDIDGGVLTLAFTGSGLTRDVTFVEAPALGRCATEEAFEATGSGSIGTTSGDGRFITVTLLGACAGGGSPESLVQKYEFVLASEGLLGPLAALETGGSPTAETVTWHRE